MEANKKPLYTLLFAVLANIGTYLLILNTQNTQGGIMYSDLYLMLPGGDLSAKMGASILLTIIPTVLSGLKFKGRGVLGIGIPIIMVIIGIINANTCQGKFCELASIPIFLGALIFTIFYAIGLYLRKSEVKVAKTLLGIEILLLMTGVLSLVNYSFNTSNLQNKTNSLIEESLKSSTPLEIAKVCDYIYENEVPGFPYMDCWEKAMFQYPDVDVCAFSETYSKDLCLIAEGKRYRENPEYGCEEQTTNLNQDAKILECWIEKSQTYSPRNICEWTIYSENQKKCFDYFKITPEQRYGIQLL